MDEDSDPSGTKIFSFDTPSSTLRKYTVSGVTRPIVIRDVNFEEYVRVSFKSGNLLDGNKLCGSRSSDKIEWAYNAALYSAGTMDPSDPYNQDMILNDQAPIGSTIITQPRYGGDENDPGGNGVIDITPKAGGSNECYVLLLSANGEFRLGKKAHDDSQFNPVADSGPPMNGTWTIDHATIRIEITDATGLNASPFEPGDEYYFWIKDIPSTVQNKLTSQ